MSHRAPWPFLCGLLALGVQWTAYADVDSGGGFNHAIEIELPAAVGGVRPEIALSYSSNAGNGLVGVGWELEGFPAITRMNYGNGINYNDSDVFAGPGGLLVRFNGAYRTEDESWAKYEALRCDGTPWTVGDGGPCEWKVTEPDGDVLEYGGTENSRIQAVGRGGAIREWALSKVTDANGNFYTVTYFEDTVNGDYRPLSVEYNQGNSRTKYYKVEFTYEGRNDHWREFSQSAPVDLDKRLKWITVKSGASTIRKYRLDYEYGTTTEASRLTVVQEYGNDESTLPAQTFSWQEGAQSWVWYSQTPFYGRNNGYTDADKYPILMGDWNGDGKSDIGRVHDMGMHFLLSTGSGWQEYAAGPAWGPLANGYTSANKYPLLIGDWNGDGKTDFGRVHNGGIAFQVSTGSGWQEYPGDGDGGVNRGFEDANRYPILIGDWNGDGKTDFGRVNDTGMYMRISTGTGWQGYPDGPAWGHVTNGFTDANKYPILTGDWNGDGKTDIGRVHNTGIAFQVSTGSGWQAYAGESDGGVNSGFTDGNNYPILIGDWNGDGKTDFGRVHNAGMYMRTSTGSGWQSYPEGPPWGHVTNSFTDGNKYPVLTGDWNGDGKTDIGRVHNAGVNFQISTGAGWRGYTGFSSWGLNLGYENGSKYPIFSGDWTGEGKSGLGRVDNEKVTFITRTGDLPDLLTSITNMLRGTTTITYRPATLVTGAVRPDLGTCIGATGATCGNANPSPTPLVVSVAVSNGLGATYSTTHEYGNSRYFPGIPTVAENLGFSWAKVTNDQLGTWQATTYRQDKPYQGRVSTIEEHASVIDPAGDLIGREHFDYATIASPHGTRLIRTIEEEQEHWEPRSYQYSIRTTYGHDAFGNVSRISRLNDASTSADDVHTFTSYVNDAAQWRIGVASLTETCSGTYAAGTATCDVVLQQVQNYYDGLGAGVVGARTLPTKVATWRSDTTTWLEMRQTYDASGNLLTRTNPIGVVAVTHEYDPATGALLETTDAIGNTVTNTYDAVTGELTSTTDPNGNASYFSYDKFGRKIRTETPHDGTLRSVVEESFGYGLSPPGVHVQTVHTDGAPLVATKHLDGLGRVTRLVQTWDNGQQLHTIKHYDLAGREHMTCPPRSGESIQGDCTTKLFDQAGRVVQVDAPRSGGGFSTITTAYNGYRTATTDEAGNVSVTDYDPATLTSTLAQPGGLVTSTQKDVLGRVVRVTDPAGNVATYTYNSLGWKLSQDDPVTGRTTFGYDAVGQLVTQSDASGAATNMYYDEAGRLVRTDYAPLDASAAGEEDTVLQYDHLESPGDVANGRSRLVRVQDRSGTTTTSYDEAGRTRTIVKTVDGADYVSTTSYDRSGKRTSLTYPDGSVVGYRYDTTARHLTAITLDGIDVMSYGDYNDHGQPTSFTYGNHVETVSLTFEATTGKLLGLQDSLGFVDNAYTYGVRGLLDTEQDQRSSKPNGDTSKAFAYDALEQLVGAAMGAGASCSASSCSGSAWSRAYTYDQVGRVLEKDGRAFNYDLTERFQLKRLGDESADRTYDAVGRLTSKTDATGVSETYVNGSDGFMREHSRGGATLHRMTYDYLGNRVKKEYLGESPTTTWEIGNYRVTFANGKYYHTLYVSGLHGSRVAHRTVQRPGMAAVASSSAYQDRALASLYEPTSAGGLLPWAEHQMLATFKTVLNDLDGARGSASALMALGVFVLVLALCITSLAQLGRLFSASRRTLQSVPV